MVERWGPSTPMCETGSTSGLSEEWRQKPVASQEAIDEAKRQAIARAFEQVRGDYAAAAGLLGVHPNYLYRLMRNLGMR